MTFAEALRKDANGTPLANADLANILTLKVNDNTGNTIGFAASIDEAKKVITLNPTSNLAEGTVYVAISAEHFDAAGNQGALRTATFTVDTTAPAAPEFSPANAATVSDASTDITITFAEALRKDANGTALANADLANILTLAKDDQNGAGIGFAATIDADKKVITLNPTSDLDPGKVYVAHQRPNTSTPPATRAPCAAPPSPSTRPRRRSRSPACRRRSTRTPPSPRPSPSPRT